MISNKIHKLYYSMILVISMSFMPVAYGAKIELLIATGAGFSIVSTDFGNPCTQNSGEYPAIFTNGTPDPVDVTIQLVNFGEGNLFIVYGGLLGIVVPPPGAQSRPTIARLTVASTDAVKIHGQSSQCAWSAIVQPN